MPPAKLLQRLFFQSSNRIMIRKFLSLRPYLFTAVLVAIAPLGACAAMVVPPDGTGGATGSGGASSGGAGSGGAPMGSGGDWQGEGLASVPAGPTFQFVRKITAVWTPTCLGADCHGGTPAHINLTPDWGLYDRLTTGMSDSVCLDANGAPMKLIVPGDPANSAFLRILKGPCETVGRMPSGDCIEGSDCLDAGTIGHVEQWILDGAPNN
jgi:hypothetical protein